MTVYSITAANSVFANLGAAFVNGSPGADSLIVAADAFLFSAVGNGAVLNGPGAWTATVHGSIRGSGSTGMVFGSGLGPGSTLTVGSAGSVVGLGTAISAASPIAIVNRGWIEGTAGGVGQAITLAGAGLHTITNSGIIQMLSDGRVAIVDTDGLGTQRIVNSGTIRGGIGLAGGADEVTNSGLISGSSVDLGAGANRVVNSGSIVMTYLTFEGGDDILTNSGYLGRGGGGGIGNFVWMGDGNNQVINRATGDIVISELIGGIGADTLINHGSLALNDILFGANNDTISNTGIIGASTIDLGSGNDRLTNSGTFTATGLINLGSGTNRVTNGGLVEGTLTGGADADIVTNSGRIEGSILLGAGADQFSNTGEVTGSVAMNAMQPLAQGFANSGWIGGDVLLDDGSDTVTHRGTIDGMLNMFSGNNTLTNRGTIGGDLRGGADADVVTNFEMDGTVRVSGRIDGWIVLSSGNDRFYGGDNSEWVVDGADQDRSYLGQGNDSYVAAPFTSPTSMVLDAHDTTSGGNGVDFLYLGDPSVRWVINLDTVAHSLFGVPQYTAAANAGIADGIQVETLLLFENAQGSARQDVIYGTAGANTILGQEGQDLLIGLGGSDVMLGGGDNDYLLGGAGRDTLTGGTGADRFAFSLASDSPTGSGRDLIVDFSVVDGDRIDLMDIDANRTNAPGTNDVFTGFLGENVLFPLNTPGTLRAIWTASGYVIEGNTDNDQSADFQIEVYNPQHNIGLTSAMFLF